MMEYVKITATQRANLLAYERDESKPDLMLKVIDGAQPTDCCYVNKDGTFDIEQGVYDFVARNGFKWGE